MSVRVLIHTTILPFGLYLLLGVTANIWFIRTANVLNNGSEWTLKSLDLISSFYFIISINQFNLYWSFSVNSLVTTPTLQKSFCNAVCPEVLTWPVRTGLPGWVRPSSGIFTVGTSLERPRPSYTVLNSRTQRTPCLQTDNLLDWRLS